MIFKALIILGATAFAGRAPLDHTQRPARSSLGCMHAAIRGKLPASLTRQTRPLPGDGLHRPAMELLPEAYLAGLARNCRTYSTVVTPSGVTCALTPMARAAHASAASDADVQRCCSRP